MVRFDGFTLLCMVIGWAGGWLMGRALLRIEHRDRLARIYRHTLGRDA